MVKTVSSTSTYRFHKIDDKTLFELCKDLSTFFPENSPTCNLMLVPGLNIPLADVEDASSLVGRYAFSAANFSVSLGGSTSFTMNFRRKITEATGQIPSAIYDEIDVNFGRDASEWKDKVKLIEDISSTISNLGLGPSNTNGEDADVLRELIQGFGASHRQMLASLDEEIKKSETRRAKTEEEFLKKEEERVKAHEEALEELDAERAKLQLQSHMSERRKLLGEMTSQSAAAVRKSMERVCFFYYTGDNGSSL